MNRAKSGDKLFLGTVFFLVIAGTFIFASASLGLLSRSDIGIQSIALKQILIGLVGGIISFTIVSKIHYKHWRPLALPIFISTIILTTLIFIPGVGISHGGASRWIDILGFSLQPSEILKLGFVLFLAWFFTSSYASRKSPLYNFLPFIGALTLVGILLLKQPDTGTFMVFFTTGVAMYFASGGSWKKLAMLLFSAILGIALLAFFRPYVKDRITTFLDPSQDAQGSSYQIQQAFIAIGSGGMFGRGFGQSVQKFNFLPEPIGDSIFAVAGEEFGFMGSLVIVLSFLLFILRGLAISAKAPDLFGRLLGTGLVILIGSQSFINIAALTGLIPLTGVPLLFVSQGGTALLLALIESGIVVNISRHSSTA
ncbi:MAG: putative peptidoglycan glycosyltransferase FtsW [Patescibacteria group bacterium]